MHAYSFRNIKVQKFFFSFLLLFPGNDKDVLCKTFKKIMDLKIELDESKYGLEEQGRKILAVSNENSHMWMKVSL